MESLKKIIIEYCADYDLYGKHEEFEFEMDGKLFIVDFTAEKSTTLPDFGGDYFSPSDGAEINYEILEMNVKNVYSLDYEIEYKAIKNYINGIGKN